ncbi:MAG: hypothetical protein E7369_02260 [Clostridiales bacterium]|nr:hypothetical protein [Clostridiales bacterium]
MKLGKLKMFLVLLFSVVMALSIVACNDPDPEGPNGCDCCTQCEDCICEAGEACNPDCECDCETCNPQAPGPVEDTTSPVITFAQGKQDSYTTTAGTAVTLPLATVTDNVDTELELDVSVTSKGATITKKTEGYEFLSDTASTYYVSYYAIDTAENETEEFITVVVNPVVAESTVTAEQKNITVLEDGGTYVENFEKGYSGDIAKGLTYSNSVGEPNASVKATDDSIAGNSLFIDYNTCAWNTNTQFWFGSLDDYIKSGKWTVSMDVKVLGGTAPSGLYLSFICDGTESGTDQSIALATDGTVKTVSTEGLYTFDETKNWHFRIFFYTGNSDYSYENFVIVIDNITFTYKYVENDVADRTATPKTLTIADLTGTNGYTLTGADDNYTAVSGSGAPTYLIKNKLVASERLTTDQAANITAANGFNSDYVILANAQLNWFDAIKGICSTNVNYTYTLTLKVYSVGNAQWHFFYADGAGGGATAITSVSVPTGVSTMTCEFEGGASKSQIGLYLNGVLDLFIGDITIKATEKSVDDTATRTDTAKTLSLTDITTTNGYTLTGAENNYTTITGSAIFVDKTKLVASERLTATELENLSAANGFNANYISVMTSQLNWFDALNNLCTNDGYTYTITIKLYSAKGASNWHLFYGGAGGNISMKQISDFTGLTTLTHEFVGNANYSTIGLYGGNTSEVFLGDITVTAVERQQTNTTPNGYEVGQVWNKTLSEVNSFGKATSVTTSEVTVGGQALSEYAGFGATALHFNTDAADKTCEMFQAGGTIETGSKYKITMVVYVDEVNPVATDSRLMLRIDNSFIDLSYNMGLNTIEIEYSAEANADFVSFYFPGSTVSIYLASFSYELIEL